jgi:hypothetical protein
MVPETPPTLATQLNPLATTTYASNDRAEHLPDLRRIFQASLAHGLPCLKDPPLSNSGQALAYFDLLAGGITRDMREGPSSPLAQLVKLVRSSVDCPERQSIEPPCLEMVEADQDVRERLRRRGQLG